MSSGSPTSPSGDRRRMAASTSAIRSGVPRCVMGVTTKPGATQFTRTPTGPPSWAAARVRTATPALAIE